MDRARVSAGTSWESEETICVVMKLVGSKCHDPLTNREAEANTTAERGELGEDQRGRTNKTHTEALTRGNNISADSPFPINQIPFSYLLLPLRKRLQNRMKSIVRRLYYILGGWGLMERAQRVRRVVGSLRDTGPPRRLVGRRAR